MLLAARAGREVERSSGTGIGIVADRQTPQAVDRQRISIRIHKRLYENPGRGVVRVDPPIAEVTDQQGSADVAESGWRDRQSPGRIERALGNQAAEKGSVQI